MSPWWWLGWLALPYHAMSGLRVVLYQRGWLPSRRLPCRVVSVGNLTVGGTGKTPVVIFLAEWLLSQGKRVAVLSRGYRRASRVPQLLVSDGQRLLVGPDEAGDEPYLIAKRCPQAIVAVGADRHRLGQWLLERYPVDCMLLDDGFQHLSLFRDVNLLLIDATDVAGLRGVLPVGRLREPLAGVSRATAVIVTRAETRRDAEPVLACLTQATGWVIDPILVSFKVDVLVNLVTDEREDPARFRGRSIVAFSGVGNAASFRATIKGIGLTVRDEVIFDDHHRYSPADLDDIRRRAKQTGAELLVTTEKDAGKMTSFLTQEDRCWAIRLRADVREGRERLEQLLLGHSDDVKAEACA